MIGDMAGGSAMYLAVAALGHAAESTYTGPLELDGNPKGASVLADEAGPSFGSPFHFTETGGAAVYNAVCAGCHMADGRGAVGAGGYPALAGDKRLAAAGYPIARVLHGRGAMPPFARTLSDDQVAAVVGFIRSQFGNAYRDAPTPAEVAAAR